MQTITDFIFHQMDDFLLEESGEKFHAVIPKKHLDHMISHFKEIERLHIEAAFNAGKFSCTFKESDFEKYYNKKYENGITEAL